MNRRDRDIFLGFGWACIVAVGLFALAQYGSAPGRASAATNDWPTQINRPHDQYEFTLLMFTHPNCPCTRASLAELAILMAHASNRFTCQVVLFQPGASRYEIIHSRMWDLASDIPGVQTIADDHGVLTAAFDARTSGQTFVYDSAGHLIFSGGITSSRGHQGDNVGLDFLLQLGENKASPISTAASVKTPVYGCDLGLDELHTKLGSAR